MTQKTLMDIEETRELVRLHNFTLLMGKRMNLYINLVKKLNRLKDDKKISDTIERYRHDVSYIDKEMNQYVVAK